MPCTRWKRDEATKRCTGCWDWTAARLNAFRKLTAGSRRPTYRDLLGVLCLDAEADYMLHRFADPTFLLIEALLDALGRGRHPEAVATSGASVTVAGVRSNLERSPGEVRRGARWISAEAPAT